MLLSNTINNKRNVLLMWAVQFGNGEQIDEKTGKTTIAQDTIKDV